MAAQGWYTYSWETIPGNSDTILYLGGKEKTTLKEISEILGKETIDSFNTSETRGRELSHGLNYQKLGKQLMTEDEIAVMDEASLLAAFQGLHPLLMVQNPLADAQTLGGDLQQLVVRQELQALLQAQDPMGHQAQGLVAAAGPHIGQLLLLADVDGDVLLLGADANHHAGVDRNACADEQRAPLLGVEEAVGNGLAGLEGDEAAGVPAAQVALVGGVAVKDGGHDALAPGIGQKLVAVAEEAPGGNQKLQLHPVTHGGHLHQVALPGAHLLDDRAHAVGGHVGHQPLDGLAADAVDLLVEHPGRRHLELVALPAHGFNQDGQVHFAPAGYVEGVHSSVDLRDPERHVLQRLPEQPVPDLAGGDELALPAAEGGVVDGEGHLHGGGGNLYKGQGLGTGGGANGIPDGDVPDAAHGNNAAGGGLGDGLLAQAVKFVNADGLGLLGGGASVVVVAHRDFLVLLDGSPLNAAHGDAPHELVVVDGTDQHLEGRLHIGLGGGDVVEDGFEEGLQVRAQILGVVGADAPSGGAEEHGAVQLLIGGVQIDEQVAALVDDLIDPLVGPVDLVDHHDHTVAQLQGLGEDEPGLGHGALGGVHQQDDAVDHFQDALHLAAEIGVAGGVDNVDLGVAVLDGGIFGQDGDAPLPLQIAGVHYAVHDLLVFPVDAALLEHLVHQGGLAVVHVGDNGDVS